MKSRILLALVCLLPGWLVAQETFPVNGARNPDNTLYAFTNATVWVDYQTSLSNAKLLVKNGKVVAVGVDVEIPAGAAVEDLQSKYIYPSFIDLYSDYGMPKVAQKPKGKHGGKGPQPLSDKKGPFCWNEAIRPEISAAEDFAPNAEQAKALRNAGFGVVLTQQHDGIMRGDAALVALRQDRENTAVLVPHAANGLSFQKGSSSQNYPSSLMGSIALLRQTYYDAHWYADQAGKTATDLSLEALNGNAGLPSFFKVRDHLGALRADKVGDEFGIQYILVGAGDEYKRTEALKATEASFVLPVNFPDAYDVADPYDARMVTLGDMKHWEMAPANAARLHEAGIPIAFTASGLKKPEAFRQQLAKAIANGLSDTAALQSVTAVPAALLNRQDEFGALNPGMHANFLITSGPVFDPETKLYENWVSGVQYILNDYRIPDVRGNYDLNVDGKVLKLVVSGGEVKPKAEVISGTDTLKARVDQDKLLIALAWQEEKENNFIQLSGKINHGSGSWDGQGQLADGSWVEWNAIRSKVHEDKKKPQPTSVAEGKITYPNMAYGLDSMPMPETVLFTNVTVWTNGERGIVKADVLIRDGKIVEVGEGLAPEGEHRTIDGSGKHVTSGIIDEHSHIAISRGVNEGSQASSAEVSIGDVINPDDINVYRQLAGGVTAAQLLHGSANPIGGQSGIVKFRWGSTPDQMKIADAAPFIKFALGENVKHSNAGEKNTTRFPQTRMGVEQVYYDHFHRALVYKAEWNAWNNLKKKEKLGKTAPRKDLELEALLQILEQQRFISCHSYQQGEINMLMHVADSMGFTVNTFTHILEGYKVADKMKAHGAGGSTFSDWWAYKFEVNDAIPYNAALMHNQGITVAINSDDAEMGRRLNQEAAKGVKYGGMSEEEAWKMVTLNPAKLLHLDHRMGSVEAGKDADLVLWSANPLSVYAQVEQTYVDGICYFDQTRDAELRKQITAERQRLIAKMLQAKKRGEKTQKPVHKEHKLYHCDTLEE